MTLAPLLRADPIVQIHAIAAMLALGIAVLMFTLPRGTPLHKRMGRVWVASMAVTALSSFGIWGFRLIGPFSPIHLLSAYVLYGLVGAVRAARQGRIAEHQAIMKSIVFWGLIVAGAFTFIPGRIMFSVVGDG